MDENNFKICVVDADKARKKTVSKSDTKRAKEKAKR